MSLSVIVNALLECEFKENENLISVLSNVKSSKASPEDSHIASLVRGLCTHNSKLIGLVLNCQDELKQEEIVHIDSFKLFVNSFILWAETATAVFERYLQCLGLKITLEVFCSPILHCGCYLAFINSALDNIRNPFVVEKLRLYQKRFKTILETYSHLREQEKLNNISFEKVQAFSGQKNVSAHFSLDQIIDRTKNLSIQLDGIDVELILLNLIRKPTQESAFNALAITELSNKEETRFVLFPPFRVNELVMTVSTNSIVLKSPVSSGSDNYLMLESSNDVIQTWSDKLKTLFPSETVSVPSPEVVSYGLGIEAQPDHSCEYASLKSLELESECSGNADVSEFSEQQKDDWDLIMEKTLSNHGIETRELMSKEARIVKECERVSSNVEYGYAEDGESILEEEDDDLSCFEIVNGPNKNRTASASLPDLLPTEQKVYTNMVGSEFNINDFGKGYNPSFLSLVDENLASTSKGPKKARRKSLFSIFKKNKPKFDIPICETSNEPIPQEATDAPAEPKKSVKPNLSVIVPENSDFVNTNLPLSSSSSTFGRSLPLPFALPNSESIYFFKKVPDSNLMAHNNSTTSLLHAHNDEPLIIPEDLKLTINSEETKDVYITPSSPGSLTVSKWKTRTGKWEMLTTNENLFIKIVENRQLEKCWMLVFKEEFDEELEELVDLPLLILSIDANTNVRQSSALDLEVSAINAITKEKLLIITRCYNTGLLRTLFTSLIDVKDASASNTKSKQLTSLDSDNTLASSLMSGKPSASSTLTSIYTVLNDPKSNSTTPAVTPEAYKSIGERLLLDRMTIKLHKQMDSYERINHISSWKSIAMYTMKLLHSTEEGEKGFYHFELVPQDGEKDECPKFLWSFDMSTIFDKIEIIGKAGLLVKVDDKEIFMVECKGKKQLTRLYKIF